MMIKPTKKLLLPVLALGLLGLLALYILWRTSPMQLGKDAFADTGLPNRTLAQAKTLSKAQNKPLLIDFSAYWCPTCRQLDRTVLSNDEVKQRIADQYVFVRLDSEAEGTRDLMKRYGLYGFPSLLVTDADGNLIRRLPVTFSAEEFLSSLSH